jgi:hypothetical protein
MQRSRTQCPRDQQIASAKKSGICKMLIVKASRDPNTKHAHALYAYSALCLTTEG